MLLGGVTVPIAQRQIPSVPDSFKIPVAANSSKTVIVRYEPRFNAAYAYDIVNDERALMKLDGLYSASFIAYNAIMLVILLGALIALVIFKDKLFAVYAAFVGSALAFQWLLSGYARYLVDTVLIPKLGIVFAIAMFFTLALFIRVLFAKPIRQYKVVRYAVVAMFIVLPIMATAIFILPFSFWMNALTQKVIFPITTLTLLLVLLFLFFKKTKYSGYVLSGLSVFVITTMVTQRYFAGSLPLPLSPLPLMQFGSVVEALAFLSLLLSRIYQALVRAKLKSENTANELSASQKIGDVGTWIFNPKTLMFTFNPYLLEKYQWPDAEVSFAQVSQRFSPQDAQTAHAFLERTLAGNAVEPWIHQHHVNTETSYWIESSWEAQRDTAGNIVSVIGMDKDITRKVAAEENERSLQQSLDNAKRVAPVGSWIYDFQSSTFTCDSALKAIYGSNKQIYSLEEVLAKYVNEDERQQALVYFHRTINEKCGAHFTHAYQATDDVLYIETIWDVELDSEGNVARAIGMDRDVTSQVLAERKASEQEALLMHQNRLAQQGEMLNMISHQWRQPLHLIGTHLRTLQLLVETTQYPAKNVDTYVNKALDNVFYLSRTIDDFQNFFSTDKEKVPCRLAEVIDETLSIIDVRLKKNNVDITRDFAEIAFQEIAFYKIGSSGVLTNISVSAFIKIVAIDVHIVFFHIPNKHRQLDNCIGDECKPKPINTTY